MSNTVLVNKAYRPFRVEENNQVYAYFAKLKAWLPVTKTNKKNQFGDYIFKLSNPVLTGERGRRDMDAVMAKKITLATFKKFLRENHDNLFFMPESSFDGMTDCIQQCEKPTPRKAEHTADYGEHTLGISGVWLVGSSRDYFQPFEDELFKGISVSNCCGSFSVGIMREAR